jgi:hypothetical protein
MGQTSCRERAKGARSEREENHIPCLVLQSTQRESPRQGTAHDWFSYTGVYNKYVVTSTNTAGKGK